MDKKFQYIKGLINKSNDFEFKSGKLNTKEYIKVLRELSAVDYEYYSVCFVKEKLYSNGFKFPKSFYKYAFSYLIKNLMDYLGGQVNLYFDQYSNKNSEFEKEFLNYIGKDYNDLSKQMLEYWKEQKEKETENIEKTKNTKIVN